MFPVFLFFLIIIRFRQGQSLISRGVFRIQSNIYEGSILQKKLITTFLVLFDDKTYTRITLLSGSCNIKEIYQESVLIFTFFGSNLILSMSDSEATFQRCS